MRISIYLKIISAILFVAMTAFGADDHRKRPFPASIVSVEAAPKRVRGEEKQVIAPAVVPVVENLPYKFELLLDKDKASGHWQAMHPVHQATLNSAKAVLLAGLRLPFSSDGKKFGRIDFPLLRVKAVDPADDADLNGAIRITPNMAYAAPTIPIFSLLDLWLHSPGDYPSNWATAARQDTGSILVNLPKNNIEFMTLKGFIQGKKDQRIFIHSIKRVENKLQWHGFLSNRKKLLFKYKQQKNLDLSTSLLFHGTRGAAPEVIYQGEDGFDLREASKRNFYGRGIYFTDNFFYALLYSHRTDHGTRQVFLSLVNTAEVKDYKEEKNRELNKPPVQEEGEPYAGQRYDSVSGYHNAARMYVIYDNQQAYPGYLVEFSDRAEVMSLAVFGNRPPPHNSNWLWQEVDSIMKGWPSYVNIKAGQGWPVKALGLHSLARWLKALYQNEKFLCTKDGIQTITDEVIIITIANKARKVIGDIQAIYGVDWVYDESQIFLLSYFTEIDAINKEKNIIPDSPHRPILDFDEELSNNRLHDIAASMKIKWDENLHKLNHIANTSDNFAKIAAWLVDADKGPNSINNFIDLRNHQAMISSFEDYLASLPVVAAPPAR